jgi:hypothetical protein
MQRHPQKVKCEDTLRAGKEQIKWMIAASSTVMVFESATGGNVSFCSAALYWKSLITRNSFKR